jgi:hypothetical protein
LAGSFISNRGGEVVVTRVPRDVEPGRTLGVRVAKEGYVFAHTTISTGEKKKFDGELLTRVDDGDVRKEGICLA